MAVQKSMQNDQKLVFYKGAIFIQYERACWGIGKVGYRGGVEGYRGVGAAYGEGEKVGECLPVDQ